MDFSELSVFFGKNLMFSFVIVLITFVLGWLLYNYIVLRKINLKDSLFEKDNPAAWIEFIGAFVFPALFLSANAIKGSAHENIFMDLLYCNIYAVVYIVIFTLLRLCSGLFIKLIGIKDDKGKVALNDEIYIQKNISASLFSVTLSLVFVNLIRFFEITSEYLTTSLLTISNILVFTLAAFIVYSLILKFKTTLFKEVFIDNNVAAGACLLGFMFAVQTILVNAVELQSGFDFYELVIFSATSLVLFGILSLVFNFIFSKIVKVNIWKEIYEQNSLGAAIGQSALFIGIANIIISFIK